jgi:pyruvate/2-oxoglutarate dehydrogenase complex dihydrolipoamide dehydrogenase (E3) component
VPSKSLIKVASVAHHARTAARYGIGVSAPTTDMTQVRAYLHATIRQIYEPTMPEALRKKGMDVLIGAVRFLDPHTLEVGTERICARKVLINTGTKPRIPAISGLANVLYLTYNRSLRTTAYLIFDRGANFNEEAIDTVKSFGIQPRRTSVRSPWQNGVAKRWVGNCRRNCSTM